MRRSCLCRRKNDLDDIPRRRDRPGRGPKPSAACPAEQQSPRPPPLRDFCAALLASRAGLLAEFKRRSPSKGWLKQDADPVVVARPIRRPGGCHSVLTDGPFFGGSLDDLRRVRASVDVPVLRKDFVIDPYQVTRRVRQARTRSCSSCPLYPRMTGGLLTEVRRLGMEALVETHDRAEVERALAADARLVGVNHRDLRTSGWT